MSQTTEQKRLRVVEQELHVAKERICNIEDLGCQTSKPANVEAFLRAVASDASHRTYYAACSDEFEEMAEAAKSYYVKLTEADGAEMPGLEELRRALHDDLFDA